MCDIYSYTANKKSFSIPGAMGPLPLVNKYYTGEGLKWHAPKGRHYNSLPISDSWRNKMSHFNSSRV